MSIWAVLLDENSETVDEWFSKAVRAFCDALEIYCMRAELSEDERDDYYGLLRWFTEIAAQMSEPLCILSQAATFPWKYSEDEYDIYLSDMSFMMPQVLSYPEFVQECRNRQDENPYVETKTMLKVVNDLLRVLHEQKPLEEWWYVEEDSIPDFKSLSQILKEAQANNVTKVRIGYE